MKIALYMAISIDGLVAKSDGDSDWVSPIDSDNFDRKIQEFGCIIVGRKTFDQYQGELYPVTEVTNIVLTSNANAAPDSQNVYYVQTPQAAIKQAEMESHRQALLIGGGTVNGSFLKEHLIDEVYISLHPLILGKGIKLFENFEKQVELELLEQQTLGKDVLQLHYRVIK
jgi:dihydrofolate reductase